MPWMSASHARMEVMNMARRTLRRRNSGRIIRLTGARHVCGTARAPLLEAWTDMLAEHQAWGGARNLLAGIAWFHQRERERDGIRITGPFCLGRSDRP
jgi:hypothetical protein